MGGVVPRRETVRLLPGGCVVSVVNIAFLGLPDVFKLTPIGMAMTLGGELLGAGADAVGNVASSIVGDVIEGLASIVIEALVGMVASILSFFWDASEPQLTGWFAGQNAPYEEMVVLAAPLLVAFVFAGVIQGALAGDSAGMLRMVLLRLPGAVLGMSMVVVIADLLLKVTDEMSRGVLDSFRSDIEQVGTVLASLSLATGSLAPLFLLLIFGFVGLLAAIVLVVLLFVRGSLIYLVAAFSPLVLAASVWEPMRGGVRKMAEIGFALIISKLAIAIALAVSSAALVGSWPNHQATEVTTPEQVAFQEAQSTTQSIGILLSSVVMFCTAAFMPFLIFRLLPMAESAVVAHGVSGGPMRAFHNLSATANSMRSNPATAALRSMGHARRQAAESTGGSSDSSGGGGGGGENTGKSSKTSKASDARRPVARQGQQTPQGQGPAKGQTPEGSGRQSGDRRTANFDDKPPHPAGEAGGQKGQSSPSTRPADGGGRSSSSSSKGETSQKDSQRGDASPASRPTGETSGRGRSPSSSPSRKPGGGSGPAGGSGSSGAGPAAGAGGAVPL